MSTRPLTRWTTPDSYNRAGEKLRATIIERDKSSKGEVLFVVMGACAAVWVVGLKLAGVL